MVYPDPVARQHLFSMLFKKLTLAIQKLWAMLVEFPISVIIMFAIIANWLRFYERLISPTHEVQVFVAKGRLARWLAGYRVGIYLPGKIILPAPPKDLIPRSCLNAVFAYGLERCRQWRRWSILFPVAYGVAAILALPYPIWNNHFTVAARDAAKR